MEVTHGAKNIRLYIHRNLQFSSYLRLNIYSSRKIFWLCNFRGSGDSRQVGDNINISGLNLLTRLHSELLKNNTDLLAKQKKRAHITLPLIDQCLPTQNSIQNILLLVFKGVVVLAPIYTDEFR